MIGTVGKKLCRKLVSLRAEKGETLTYRLPAAS